MARLNWLVPTILTVVLLTMPAHARYCTFLLEPLQAGYSDAEIASFTGLTPIDVNYCRRELSRPVLVGPQGPGPGEAVGIGPSHAPGPPPFGAVGPPPHGAVGPPPSGALGPPPAAREMRRLP